MKRTVVPIKDKPFLVILAKCNTLYGKPHEICAILFNGINELEVFHEVIDTNSENSYNNMIENFSKFYLSHFSTELEIVTHLNGFKQITIFRDMFLNKLIDIKQNPIYFIDIAKHVLNLTYE
jgi:hypothetical protein